jgi:hypothetical protein
MISFTTSYGIARDLIEETLARSIEDVVDDEQTCVA